MQEQVSNDEMEIDLMEIFHLLLRKAWIIVLAILLGGALMFGYTKGLVTPLYTSSSMIYIVGSDVNISVAELQISSQLTADYTELATSRPVIEMILDKLELDYTYKELVEQIEVTNLTDTHILKFSVTNEDKTLAADIANTMATVMSDRVVSVMGTNQPSIVERAVVSEEPSSPNTRKNVLIGALLGFLLAAGVLVVLHLLDDTIKDEDDVAKYLGLTTLAALPANEKKQRRTKKE